MKPDTDGKRKRRGTLLHTIIETHSAEPQHFASIDLHTQLVDYRALLETALKAHFVAKVAVGTDHYERWRT